MYNFTHNSIRLPWIVPYFIYLIQIYDDEVVQPEDDEATKTTKAEKTKLRLETQVKELISYSVSIRFEEWEYTTMYVMW